MLLCGTREAVRTRVNTPLRDQEAHDSCSGNLHARYLHRSGREWYSKTASNKLLCFKHFDRINKVSSYGSIGVRWIEVIGWKWEALDHNMNSSRNSILKGTREGTINRVLHEPRHKTRSSSRCQSSHNRRNSSDVHIVCGFRTVASAETSSESTARAVAS